MPPGIDFCESVLDKYCLIEKGRDGREDNIDCRIRRAILAGADIDELNRLVVSYLAYYKEDSASKSYAQELNKFGQQFGIYIVGVPWWIYDRYLIDKEYKLAIKYASTWLGSPQAVARAERAAVDEAIKNAEYDLAVDSSGKISRLVHLK